MQSSRCSTKNRVEGCFSCKHPDESISKRQSLNQTSSRAALPHRTQGMSDTHTILWLQALKGPSGAGKSTLMVRGASDAAYGSARPFKLSGHLKGVGKVLHTGGAVIVLVCQLCCAEVLAAQAGQHVRVC